MVDNMLLVGSANKFVLLIDGEKLEEKTKYLVSFFGKKKEKKKIKTHLYLIKKHKSTSG